MDNSNFIILLIGTSKYQNKYGKSFENVPNVKTNIFELKYVFTKILKIPDNNVHIALDKDSQETKIILEDVLEKAYHADSTLFVYYSGHGCHGKKTNSVYLTTFESSQQYIEHTSIKIDEFRELIAKSPIKKKILVLDSCFSGKIADGILGDETELLKAQIDIYGTYAIASSPKDKPSEYDATNPKIPTYFTGEFIDILKNGINKYVEILSIGEIFDEVARRLRSKGRPEPIPLNKEHGDKILFTNNPKYEQIKLEKKKSKIKPQKTEQIIVEEEEEIILKLETEEGSPANPIVDVQKVRNEETELWYETLMKNTVIDYDYYLNLFPTGTYSQTALNNKNRLLQIEKNQKELQNVQEKEKEFWMTTESLHTIKSYKAYLRSYPFGHFVDEANIQIGILETEIAVNKEDSYWEFVLKENTINKYKRYIKRYYKGRYKEKAEEYIKILENDIDETTWIKASKIDSTIAYRKYINKMRKLKINGWKKEINGYNHYGKYEEMASNRLRELTKPFDDDISVFVVIGISIITGIFHIICCNIEFWHWLEWHWFWKILMMIVSTFCIGLLDYGLRILLTFVATETWEYRNDVPLFQLSFILLIYIVLVFGIFFFTDFFEYINLSLYFFYSIPISFTLAAVSYRIYRKLFLPRYR
jgi:hypothetical protein